jgi:hypothetical protein
VVSILDDHGQQDDQQGVAVALGVEFASVIARTADADRALPGGLDEFAPTQPNYIEDDHLFRVGFMSTIEATDLVDHLLRLGLPDETVAVVQMDRLLPGWLQRGVIDGVRAVWLAERVPGRVIPPLQGFLLRGPVRLGDIVTRLHDDGEISVRRVPSTECEAERLEITRGDALIDLDLIRPQGTDSVGFWATRRRDRSRCCRADIPLLEWLSMALRAAGASHLSP